MLTFAVEMTCEQAAYIIGGLALATQVAPPPDEVMEELVTVTDAIISAHDNAHDIEDGPLPPEDVQSLLNDILSLPEVTDVGLSPEDNNPAF